MPIETDLSVLDQPEVTRILFYPRKESGRTSPGFAENLDILTENGIRIGTRLYLTEPDMPHILFFHGNGEIAEDYDDIGSVYTNFGLNFLVADYRGYGRSSGTPGVAAMFIDARHVIDHFSIWKAQNQRKGPLWVMGRSLGSAPAIALAAEYPDSVNGLIIESGFAQTLPLLQRLGINTAGLNIKDSEVFSNTAALTRYFGPTLIIHGEYDQIIPLHHGQELFETSPAIRKELHIVKNADHNSLLMFAGKTYFEIIRDFIDPSMDS